ncbi:MAG: hydroxyacylglutathione hydrolase [Lentisphaeria bacterium]|jgi:hydroxyacylglutathione hydrolase
MFKITPIPIFENNYVWAIRHPAEAKVIIVDPGDSEPVIEYLQRHKLSLQALLITHSHYDHIDGIDSLLQAVTQQSDEKPVVYGPKCDRIPQVTHKLKEGDSLSIWNYTLSVMETPGHLPEHLSYLLSSDGQSALFCGDVMFSSGCGRNFVGPVSDLKASLDRFKTLAPDTKVYCAHEYTLSNLKFARTIEPSNPALMERELVVGQARKAGLPSVPTTVATELKVNPFLRCDSPELIKSAALRSGHQTLNELDVFTILRKWKDVF